MQDTSNWDSQVSWVKFDYQVQIQKEPAVTN